MLKPLDDRIIIRKNEAKTAIGGILLPETVKQEPMEGEVVAVGPGRYEKGVRIEPVVKVGDRVLFGAWSAKDIVVDDEKLSTMREDDIIGILKEK